MGILAVVGMLRLAQESYTASDEVVTIGAAFALSGDAAPWGEVSQKAAQLAVDSINDSGGINGKKLELIVEDTKSSSKDSVSAVSKLVNVDKVEAVMITWLDSYQGAESVVPLTVPLISQDAAIESVNVPVNHPNVFSLWYRTASKAKTTIKDMVQSGVKKLYVVTLNDAYYATLRQFLVAEAEKQGIIVVGDEALNVGDDTRTSIAKVKREKPDAVFFGSYDDTLSVAFFKRYYELTGGMPLWGDEFVEQNISNQNFNPIWLEGVRYYVPAEPSSEFSNAYKARFGEAPRFSAQTTYDTTNILAAYLRAMPTDVSEYMRSTAFDTVTYGSITFDAIGGVITNTEGITMKSIEKGKPVVQI